MSKTMSVRTTIAAILAGLALSAYAIADPARQINVPAGELVAALEALSRQAAVDLVFQPDQLKSFRTSGVKGTYSPQDAIRILLEGTPFQLRTDAVSGAMVIAPSPGVPKSSGADQPAKATDIEEIVVTGSHIRGVEAAGSKLLQIDRAAINASGYGRIEDVLGTLTQNFGGFKEAVLNGGAGVGNVSYGAEIQLRGLGVGTTLTLVNGQRQAMGGSQGAITDISSIPTSAIERIEVLPEGASALYGSDAIGGVVNVILRRDVQGFETMVRGGTAGNEATERQIAQLWGHTWSNGHLTLGYQYNDRDELPASERSYLASNGNFTSFGGSDLRLVGGNPGTLTLNGQSYAIPAGQNGTALTLSQLTPGRNYSEQSRFTDVLPSQQMHAGFLDSSYRIAEDWEIRLGGRYSKREFTARRAQAQRTFNVPTTNAFNQFGSAVRVGYDLSEDLGPLTARGNQVTSVIAAGLQGSLARDWKINVSGSSSRSTSLNVVYNSPNFVALNAALASSDPATALNVFGDGSNTSVATLASIRSAPFQRDRSSMTSADVVADGPVFDMPAGPVRLAVGGGYRKEDVWTLISEAGASTAQDRHITAAYAELAVPILGPREADSPAGRLDVSLAARHESYSDAGSTTNPKVGVSWQALSSVKVRGTWGTSFRAPPFYNSNRAETGSFVLQIPDATGAFVDVLGLFGPGPNLKPERAHVWTAGLDVAPLRNVLASFTYFDIDYEDKIQYAGQINDFLTQPEVYSSVTTLSPTQAQLDALCGPNGPFPVYPGLGTCTGPVVAIVDNSVRNLAISRTRGVDADVRYSLQSSVGSWDLGLSGTYTFNFDKQITAAAPVVNVIDTVSNPLKLRASGSVGWHLGAWNAQTSVNFAGAYEDTSPVPARNVSSWTTVDLNVGFRTGTDAQWLSETEIHFGAINLFDKRPPFVNQYTIVTGVLGYDSSNASILGRMVSLQAVKKW